MKSLRTYLPTLAPFCIFAFPRVASAQNFDLTQISKLTLRYNADNDETSVEVE